jgi:hypothetical protein
LELKAQIRTVEDRTQTPGTKSQTSQHREQMGTDGNRLKEIETRGLEMPRLSSSGIQSKFRNFMSNKPQNGFSILHIDLIDQRSQLFWPPHIAESWESTQGKQSDVK